MTLGEASVLGGLIVQTLAVLAMFLRLNARIDKLGGDLNSRIDRLGERLDARIDALVTSMAGHTAQRH